MVNGGSVTQDFMGVKIGDLNASAAAHAGMVTPRSDNAIALRAVDRFVTAGETFEVELQLEDNGRMVLGGQWDLKFKDAVIGQILPVAPGLTEDMWNVGENDVRFAWTPREAVRPGTVIKLVMRATQSGKISEMMSITNEVLMPEIYDEDENVYTVNLDWVSESELAGGEEIQLHQNHPNPWDTETVIPFEIAESGEVTLNITNALGEEVHSITQTFAAGKQQFKISNHSWPQGLYYYTVRFGDTQLTKTMLILSKH